MTRTSSADLEFPTREIASEKVHQEQIYVIDTTRHWASEELIDQTCFKKINRKTF